MHLQQYRKEMAELKDEILSLKKERNAVILAHNYQVEEIQDIADYVGDSFGLSLQAKNTSAEVVVFCGVHFMAESAHILAPDKIVLLPERGAGCPLANTITAEELRRVKAQYPNTPVVCYVNSSAEVKAESDICCTSSNAVEVVNSLEAQEVIFVPDANLAFWVSQHTAKRIIPWDGHCIPHHRVLFQEFVNVKKAHPGAKLAVHPECRPEISTKADFVGSTSAIIKYARETDADTVIIGTEMGVIPLIKKENPGKKIYLLSPKLICYNMKLTTPQKLLSSLKSLEPKITVPPDTRRRAEASLTRMLQIK